MIKRRMGKNVLAKVRAAVNPNRPRDRRGAIARMAAVATVLGAGFIASGVKPARASTPIALGAFVSDSSLGGTAPHVGAVIDNYSALVGRTPAIVMWYENWAGAYSGFNTNDFNTVEARGAIPEVVWEPWAGKNPDPTYKLTNIVNGNFDSYIRAWATAAKTWGHPLYLRFAHEMDATWYPWGTGLNNPEGNVPADYVAAWRHVHDIFTSVGATNVLWLWTPSRQGAAGSTPYAQVFPGDNYVDRVGFDAYNYGPLTGGHWKTLAQLFTTPYNNLVSLSSKPIMVGEMGCPETGGSKAAWITQGFLTDIPTLFPRITALSWFDSINSKGVDWRVNSSSTSLAAWQQVVASPLYQGTSG